MHMCLSHTQKSGRMDYGQESDLCVSLCGERVEGMCAHLVCAKRRAGARLGLGVFRVMTIGDLSFILSGFVFHDRLVWNTPQ